MKILSLNAWAGRTMWSLTRFLRKYRDEVDVFCFQEIHDCSQEAVEQRHPDKFVRGPMFDLIRNELPGHLGMFAAHPDDGVRMSNAIFVGYDLDACFSDAEVFVPDSPVEQGSEVLTARRLQWATITREDGSELWVGNMHGMWVPNHKGDCIERVAQSENILRIVNRVAYPKVLMGDFNIYPAAKSWQMLRDAFERELVTDSNTRSTRTPLYRHYFDPALDREPIDYCFATGVGIDDFTVLPDVVTDHAPILLEIA